jgi:hypothetical protein
MAAGAFVSGANVVVESLIRHGVELIFAYPGGPSMLLHQPPSHHIPWVSRHRPPIG